MLYAVIALVLIASVLLILAVLVQSPKSGMAANFGASNQVMGVRQTTDFLEKFTWGTAVVILILSLSASLVMGGSKSSSAASKDAEALIERQESTVAPSTAVPQVEVPAEETTPAAEETSAE